MRRVTFGIAVSEETLGDAASVPLQGGIMTGISRVAAIGYHDVELHVRDPRSLDASAIARAAVDAGVRVAAVGTGLEYSRNGLCLTADDPRSAAGMADRLREHVDFAAEFGAGGGAPVVFVGLCRGTAPSYALVPAYLDRFAERLLPVAAHATAAGVTLVLEPVAFYYTNLLNTTAECLGFLRRPGLEGVELLLDTHHMYIEDCDLGAALRASRGRIGHLHASDSNRRRPGAGCIDFAAVAAVLEEIGYAGSVSVEVLPYPDGEAAAVGALAHLCEAFGA